MNKLLALPLLALVLSACDVGEGNRPQSIRFIASSTDSSAVSAVTAYECFTQSLLVLAEFTDGIPGDFTGRANYSSDRPDVVKVSNGDLLVDAAKPQGLVYSRGVLVPVSAGTANVTAEFAGLTATVAVTVRRPLALSVTNEVMTDSNGLTQHPVNAMVPGSSQQLVATATLSDGTTTFQRNVGTLGEWTHSAASDVAVINAGTGVVNALQATAAPITASFSLPPCAANPPQGEAFDYQTQYEIKAPARKLVLATERGYPGNGGAMPAGSAQLLRVLADFDTDAANGEGQDLTFKGASFTVSPAAGTLSYSGATGLLLAGGTPTTSPAQITASFGKEPNLYSSDPLAMSVIAATLDSLEVSPSTATIAPLGTQQFTATGRFTVNGVAGALTLPVNHDVNWTTSDSTVVSISNFTLTDGLALSLKNEATAAAGVTVTATSAGLLTPTVSGTAVKDDAVLQVSAPASAN